MKEWDQLSEKEQLLQYISDEYKSAYGIRPRGTFYENRTVEQLRADLDELNAYANKQYELEKAEMKEKYEEFEEKLFWIQQELGAENRMQALWWMIQDEEEAEYDPEYYIWTLGIDNFSEEGRNLLKDIVKLQQEHKAA